MDLGDPGFDAVGASTEGSANFAFSDGSVHFLKESISSWVYNPATGYPTGVTFNNSTGISIAGSRTSRVSTVKLSPLLR